MATALSSQLSLWIPTTPIVARMNVLSAKTLAVALLMDCVQQTPMAYARLSAMRIVAVLMAVVQGAVVATKKANA